MKAFSEILEEKINKQGPLEKASLSPENSTAAPLFTELPFAFGAPSPSLHRQVLHFKKSYLPTHDPKVTKARRPPVQKRVSPKQQATKRAHSTQPPHKAATSPTSGQKQQEPRDDDTTYYELSGAGQRAFCLFNQLGARLSKDSLNVHILKREYRRLAKVHHPDLGGSSPQHFMILNKAHKELQKALKGQKTKTT